MCTRMKRSKLQKLFLGLTWASFEIKFNSFFLFFCIFEFWGKVLNINKLATLQLSKPFPQQFVSLENFTEGRSMKKQLWTSLPISYVVLWLQNIFYIVERRYIILFLVRHFHGWTCTQKVNYLKLLDNKRMLWIY